MNEGEQGQDEPVDAERDLMRWNLIGKLDKPALRIEGGAA